MSKAAKTVKEILSDSQVLDARGQADTIRLWESYRSQALLWRAIALLQIPATLMALLFALMMWQGRSITLNVPYKPLPGQYPAHDVPDTDFIDFATTYVNLVSTYTPAVVERQFGEAEKMLTEPVLSRFATEMMEEQLRIIKTTFRTQIFFADPNKTKLERHGDEVIVTFEGDRRKIVAGKELPLIKSKYQVFMSTIPRSPLNEYGIVITNIAFDDVKDN